METSNSLLLSSRSDIQPLDPSQVPEFVRGDVVDQYFQVAILTVLVYDTGKRHVARRDLTLTVLQVITFDKEVCTLFLFTADE